MKEKPNETPNRPELGAGIDSCANKISDIATETSKILNVLVEPLPLPMSADGLVSSERKLAARNQQVAERERFIRRYQKAIMAFLGKKLGSADQAQEVWDLFVEKCMAGKLANYDPSRSFRKYLKTVLRNTCYEYIRLKPESTIKLDSVAGQIPDDANAEEEFDRVLVESLFNRALDAVRDVDVLQYICLKLNAEALAADVKPPNTDELARVLSLESGKEISNANARQIKSRASKQFSEKLITEVSKMICSENLDDIENALVELGILKYCKNALQRLRSSS